MEKKYPSYLAEPTCCKEHKLLCKNKKHIDVSRWKFRPPPEECLYPKNFDPLSRKCPASESRAKGMEMLEDELLDKLRKSTLSQTADDIMREGPPTSEIERQKEILKSAEPSSSKSSRSSSPSQKESVLESFKTKEAEPNPYLTLLNRLDEEEGRKDPSIEDKLKLEDDRLRVATTEFCQHSTQLATMKKPDKDDDVEIVTQSNLFIQPEAIQKLFHPQIFEQSPCPPVPLEVKEIEAPLPLLATKRTKLQEKAWKEKEKKMEALYKQGYHLPPNTWFAPDKKDPVIISPEEIELYNCFSTKEFLKFLDERKMEPPKALKKIQEKIKQLERNIMNQK